MQPLVHLMSSDGADPKRKDLRAWCVFQPFAFWHAEPLLPAQQTATLQQQLQRCHAVITVIVTVTLAKRGAPLCTRRAADHLVCLLREKGSYQKLARDSGAVPAIVKMERRESTKELLQWLVRLCQQLSARSAGIRTARGRAWLPNYSNKQHSARFCI